MLLFNVLFAAGLIVSYLSVYISPIILWWPAFLGLCFPFLIIFNVFFVLFWGFRRSLLLLLSGVLLLIGLSYFNRYFKAFPSHTNHKGIVVCSYNVKNFNGLDPRIGQRENRLNIEIWMHQNHPDIVCLQEIDSSSIHKFIPFEGKAYSTNTPTLPNTYLKTKTGNLIIYSKYPILRSGKLSFEDSPNMIIYADLKINQDTVRIYNCHLQSYMFATKDVRAFNSLWPGSQKRLLKNYQKLKYIFQKTFIERAYQADVLRKHMNDCPYSMLVCGDFNDTPVSYTYRAVKGTLKDSFVESGQGIGYTFPGHLFSFRIDYIMHSSAYSAFNFKIGHITYSDHYPILCRLVKK